MTGVDHTWTEHDDDPLGDAAEVAEGTVAPMGPVAGSFFVVCSQLVVLGLLVVAVANGFCLGPGCEPRDETTASAASLLALLVFLGGPVLVAWACRDWRWGLVPVVEVTALVVLGLALG